MVREVQVVARDLPLAPDSVCVATPASSFPRVYYASKRAFETQDPEATKETAATTGSLPEASFVPKDERSAQRLQLLDDYTILSKRTGTSPPSASNLAMHSCHWHLPSIGTF